MKYSYCSFFQILVAKCLVLLIYSKVLVLKKFPWLGLKFIAPGQRESVILDT